MPRKSSKIFINNGNELITFLWADVIKDGSIIMGFPTSVLNQIELVSDIDGEYRPPEIIAEKATSNSKITFHPSGHYKLTSTMGRSKHSVDRATVLGPELNNLINPRWMLEFLLPKEIPTKTHKPSEKDIILDASTAPKKPIRCSVFCMAKSKYYELFENGKQPIFVDTSEWEFHHALENETHAWVFVLRISKFDTEYPNRVIVGLLGKPKWGAHIIIKNIRKLIFKMRNRFTNHLNT